MIAAEFNSHAECAGGGMLQVGMGWFGEEPGGLNRLYAGLLAALGTRAANVEGVVAGDADAAAAPSNVRFFARRDASVIERLWACRRVVRERLARGDVEIVAAHFAPYAAPLLDLVGSRRFVFHFHGPWAAESAAERQRGFAVAVKRALERAVYRRASRFIVLSHAFAAVLCRDYGVAPEKIRIVPGGVDAARFAVDVTPAAARERLGLPRDRAIIGVVRRLVHRMGLEGLVDAMDSVHARVPDALLAIAGTGPLVGQLRARIQARGLDDHVRLLGFVADADLPLFYRACDLSIVPSLALEGFGLTTIESLAAGTPVLVTPVGGLPETVQALDAGLVLADARPATLAAGLADALRGALPLPSPQRCARYARTHFDWPVIAGRVLAAYG
jgi:glycosyltransferase involved in cell wall biosynthesis